MRDTRVSGFYPALFVMVWIILILVPAVLVVVIDPYQVFHRSVFKDVYFFKDNERYQMPGLIANYLGKETKTDSIIIGSSLSANFLENDVQERLGWGVINLAMRGSTVPERAVVLRHALASGRVKHVLLEIYPTDFLDDVNDPLSDKAFPAYLYGDSLTEKWRYVFNNTVIGHAVALLGRQYPFPSWLVNYLPVWDRNEWSGPGLLNWMAWKTTAAPTSEFANFSHPDNLVVLKKNLATAKDTRAQTVYEPKTYTFSIVQRDIIDVIKAHPDVEFRIWFAPVSTLRYALEPGFSLMDYAAALRRYLVPALADESHVRIYGVDDEFSITGNLANYRDFEHFDLPVQQWILDSIAHDRYRLTAANVDGYADRFLKNMMHFDVVLPTTSE